MTISGFSIGTILGCIQTTQTTIDNFVTSNEATQFSNNFHARSQLNQKVVENFLSKGGKFGLKLGFFCLLFR